MDDTTARDTASESAVAGGEERPAENDADGRRTRRVRGNKKQGISIVEGSESGAAAEGSVSSRKRVGSAKEVWGNIWHEFSEQREKSRTRAYLNVLANLTENAEILVPEMIQPKDFLDMTIHLESFVKEDSGAKEGSAIDYVSNFLNSGEVRAGKKAS